MPLKMTKRSKIVSYKELGDNDYFVLPGGSKNLLYMKKDDTTCIRIDTDKGIITFLVNGFFPQTELKLVEIVTMDITVEEV